MTASGRTCPGSDACMVVVVAVSVTCVRKIIYMGRGSNRETGIRRNAARAGTRSTNSFYLFFFTNPRVHNSASLFVTHKT